MVTGHLWLPVAAKQLLEQPFADAEHWADIFYHGLPADLVFPICDERVHPLDQNSLSKPCAHDLPTIHDDRIYIQYMHIQLSSDCGTRCSNVSHGDPSSHRGYYPCHTESWLAANGAFREIAHILAACTRCPRKCATGRLGGCWLRTFDAFSMLFPAKSRALTRCTSVGVPERMCRKGCGDLNS